MTPRTTHRPASLLALLLAPSITTAATLHVPADHLTIQGCIDAAISGQDECVVAPGTYNEAINFNGKAITLRSSDPTDPDIVADTTIDATGLNSRVITCTDGEGADTIISGLTITGGYAIGPFPDHLGGGLYCEESSPTVSRCTFVKNQSLSFGGAIFNRSSSPRIESCTFHANIAGTHGGAIGNDNSRPNITHCTFTINRNNGGKGGAIYNVFGSHARIADSTFSENTAHSGGGAIANLANSNPRIIRCFFFKNKATSSSGFAGAILNEETSPRISECTFRFNSAVVRGGAILNAEGRPTFANCEFTQNESFTGGAMYNITNAHVKVINSLFNHNTADYGAALFNYINSDLLVTGSVFTGNTTTVAGGAIENLEHSDVEFSNCILWNNAPVEIYSGRSNPRMANTNIQGSGGSANWNGQLGDDNGDNLDADPMFVRVPDDGGDGWGDDPETPDADEGANDDYGDLRLQPGSPCINAGSAALLSPDEADIDGDGDTTEPLPLDLDGHPRVLCGQVDMGAYEFGIGDFDCYGLINLADSTQWTTCMIEFGGGSYPQGCEALDYDGDETITLYDFAQFQSALTP